MKANETYTLITDLIRFREAYKVLVKDYEQSDCDFSEQYPLSPFDIMTDTNLEKAIISWLNYHITTLYALLPERVVNPLCVDCLLEHKASAMTTQDGACKLNTTCCAYPFVLFDEVSIKQYLRQQTHMKVNEADMASASTVKIAYLHLLKELKLL